MRTILTLTLALIAAVAIDAAAYEYNRADEAATAQAVAEQRTRVAVARATRCETAVHDANLVFVDERDYLIGLRDWLAYSFTHLFEHDKAQPTPNPSNLEASLNHYGVSRDACLAPR